MHKALLCSLALALAIAHQLAAQCNLPSPPGTGAQGCQNAPLFCSEEDMDGYCSTTGATGTGACPSAFCGTCENSHWLSFIAGGTVVTLTISPSNCAGQPSGTGLQAQLFATADCTNFTAVSNCDGAGQAVPITLTATGLTIGEVYYLLIDGWGGDECDYEIDVTEGIGNLPLQSSRELSPDLQTSAPAHRSTIRYHPAQGSPFTIGPFLLRSEGLPMTAAIPLRSILRRRGLPSCASPLRMPVKPARLSANRSFPPPSRLRSK